MIGKAAPLAWLTTDDSVGRVWQESGWSETEYQEFITEGMGSESIWKDLKGQIYLGDDDFVEQMQGKATGASKGR